MTINPEELELISYFLIPLALLMLFIANRIGIQTGLRLGFSQYDQAALTSNLMEKQLTILHEQHRLHIEDQRRQRFEERTEIAYEALSQWLHSLRQAVDLVQDGCQGELQDLERARAQLERWPWDTLRAPLQIAPYEPYWSPEIWYQLARFQEISARFSFDARLALTARELLLNSKEERCYWFPYELEKLWESCSDLRKTLDTIVRQSRRDLKEGIEVAGETNS
ncbi:hypothetical protein [Glycomyces dulcitolivorans]|uniref:hypothetical protein n=1 Tax=Glycomyces dulcitolivorans TaxID=2200759 RepID=UPI0013003193|nr:hypothetical protein [Glycomyces dulcitolivorans]